MGWSSRELLPCPGVCSGQEELGGAYPEKDFPIFMILWTGSVLSNVIPERADEHWSPAMHSAWYPTSWTLLGMFSPPTTRLKSFTNTPHKLNPDKKSCNGANITQKFFAYL